MRQWIGSALIQKMACHPLGAKPLRKLMLGFCQLWNKLKWNLYQNIKLLIQKNAPRNIVCEMAAILPRGRWVNTLHGRGMHSMHIQLFPFHLNFVIWCHRDIRGSWGKLWVCMYSRAQQIFGQCDLIDRPIVISSYVSELVPGDSYTNGLPDFQKFISERIAKSAIHSLHWKALTQFEPLTLKVLAELRLCMLSYYNYICCYICCCAIQYPL